MAKIKASMADVSTDFQVFEPSVYDFEIKKIEEVENKGKFPNLDTDDPIAYIVISEFQDGQYQGKQYRDYINIRTKEGALSDPGLAALKRYFEAIFGKDTVESWTDDDYDTDQLVNKGWRGQVAVESYQKNGETKQTNRIKHMEGR